MSSLADLQKRATDIRQRYAVLNAKTGNNAWGPKEYAMGYVGDVGDLLKLVMAKENLRHIDDVDAKLAHELADCLWSILVLAEQYGIDLDKEFVKTMDMLEKRIGEASK